jgi:hypothetical protein
MDGRVVGQVRIMARLMAGNAGALARMKGEAGFAGEGARAPSIEEPIAPRIKTDPPDCSSLITLRPLLIQHHRWS